VVGVPLPRAGEAFAGKYQLVRLLIPVADTLVAALVGTIAIVATRGGHHAPDGATPAASAVTKDNPLRL
jgi:hypothetical protein